MSDTKTLLRKLSESKRADDLELLSAWSDFRLAARTDPAETRRRFRALRELYFGVLDAASVRQLRPALRRFALAFRAAQRASP